MKGPCGCKGHTAAHPCPECGAPQLARNNYFTGKLLVERDFTDEQRYFLSKHRRHNQMLHGSGTVCGLKVVEHPNPACRQKYVVVKPGMAVDCCGRDIVVNREEMFDFRSAFLEHWHKLHGEDEEPDDKPHHLRICLRYCECLTEEVPALFDECGCDDTACKPNRILDSYSLQLLVDPPGHPDAPNSVELKWRRTIGLLHPVAVVSNAAAKRVYALWTPAANTTAITAIDTATGATVDTTTVASRIPLALALSPSGARLYAVVRDPAGNDGELLVLDPASLSAAPIQKLPVTASAGAAFTLAAAPDGRVAVAVSTDSKVHIWKTDINSAGVPAAPTAVAVGADPVALAFSGTHGYTANKGAAGVSAIRLSDLTVDTIAVAGSAPTSVVPVATADGDNLLILDPAAPRLFYFSYRPGTATPVTQIAALTAFAHPPASLAGSPEYPWAFVIERDTATGEGYVQGLRIGALASTPATALSPAVEAGANPRAAILSVNSEELLVVFDGTAALPGGIAILHITSANCRDAIDDIIEGCPGCESGDCLVLASIDKYVFDKAILDADIDNLTWRPLLPSTSVLMQMVLCAIENGTPGPPGQTGAQGDAGTTGANGATGTNGANGVNGTNGTNGDPGKSYEMLDLPHICAISWKHNERMRVREIERREGLVIVFDKPMVDATLTPNTLHVLLRPLNDNDRERRCFCEVNIRVVRGQSPATCRDPDTKFEADGAQPTNAVLLQPENGWEPGDYRIIADGDHILGTATIDIPFSDGSVRKLQPALDGNHMGPGLPKRCPTGDGIEGGTFLSWFTLSE